MAAQNAFLLYLLLFLIILCFLLVFLLKLFCLFWQLLLLLCLNPHCLLYFLQNPFLEFLYWTLAINLRPGFKDFMSVAFCCDLMLILLTLFELLYLLLCDCYFWLNFNTKLIEKLLKILLFNHFFVILQYLWTRFISNF